MTLTSKAAWTVVVLLFIHSRTCLASGILNWKATKVKNHESTTTTTPSECGAISRAEAEVLRYLQDSSSVPSDPGGFHVQGWRWHTMSLIREARRLHHNALRLAPVQTPQESGATMDAVHTVADYCVNFNLKGLHRVEKELFFPWLRTKAALFKDRTTARAFETVIDELEQDRQRVESLGKSLMTQASIAAGSRNSDAQRLKAIGALADEAALIAEAAQAMLQREERTVIPVVARLVSEKEQKSFNNKVIQKLGVLDARLHLVGMYEAVCDKDKEHRLFKEAIPSLPQRLIPRWKRLLYEPRASALDKVMSA